MKCPRCGNEWDANKGLCTVCGFVIRISNQGSTRDAFTPSPRDVSPRGFPEAEQRTHTTLAPLSEQWTPRPFHFTPASVPETSDFVSPFLDTQLKGISSASSGPLSPSQVLFTLEPGMLLHHGRYRLHQMQARRYWLAGLYEASWIAQDVQRAGFQVIMRELVLPENVASTMQAALQVATMSLASVGRNTHLPTLLDAFSERGRNFFVFAPIEGESLLSHMRRTGRPLAETEVIEMCLQMTEVLELLSHQSPPLVHGLISPESIVIGRGGNEYILTSFSIVLASGATQLIAGIDRNKLSPYTAPEIIRGLIDVRSDLYSVLATAYYAVTGSTPATVNGSVPPAQRINPSVSPQLNAILARGLRSDVHQRYQHPSELRQELLAIRHGAKGMFGDFGVASRQETATPLTQHSSEGKQHIEITPVSTNINDTLAQTLQSLAPDDDLDTYKTLLPRPEELPPIPEQNYKLQAGIWIASILVCLLILLIIGRGFI